MKMKEVLGVVGEIVGMVVCVGLAVLLAALFLAATPDQRSAEADVWATSK